MIVCICHRVSDRDIAREVREGCATFAELQAELRVGTRCGACTDCARKTFMACQPAGEAHTQRVVPLQIAQAGA